MRQKEQTIVYTKEISSKI